MKLAFVIPWYGTDIPGGAEAATRGLAENLASRGRPVEVLTTCIRDFHSDWARNDHREGMSTINGVTVRRFKVGRRNAHVFGDLNNRLLHQMSLTRDEEDRFMREMVNSPNLIDFVARRCAEYTYIFVPYLFSTTYWGAQACQGQAWLMPCLHDESYAYLHLLNGMFESARGVIFLSRPEMDLARRLYNLERASSSVVGVGVDANLIGDAQRFRARTGIVDPFMVYVGRRDPTKNVPLLIEYFRRYRAARNRALKLVLIGSGEVAAMGGSDEVIDLGFLTPQDKIDALAAAMVLCQPSQNESFSIAIMEAWLAGVPVLAHAECSVTSDHCRRSNGGLYFRDDLDFAGCLDFLLDHPDVARRMGELGGRYVRQNFNWDAVIQRFDHVLQL